MVFFLLFSPIAPEETYRLDQDRLIEIYIQQKQIIATQDKIDTKLEALRPYQEQVRVNTNTLLELQEAHKRMENIIGGLVIGVLICLLGIIGNFLFKIRGVDR